MKLFFIKSQIPKKYTIWDESFLVWRDFVIPFSHSVDYLFESLDTVLYDILNYIQKKDNTDLDDIKNFKQEDYLKFEKEFIRSTLEDFAWKDENISKYYIEILHEVNQLVEEFKNEFKV